MTNPTFKCDVCGKERQEAFIDILKKDRSSEFDLPEGSFTENIKFCNDNPDCFFGAEKVRLIKPKKVEEGP
jgi:hypothetical protein